MITERCFVSLRMTFAAVIVAACGKAAPGEVGPVRSPRLYVANQDDATVSIIDVNNRRLIETLDLRRLGFGDNAKPHHVQVEPDGSAWYVTLIGAGKVLKLDRSNRLLASANLEVPGLITLHPTQDLMYVGRSMSAVNPPPRVAAVRRSDMKVLDEIDLLFPRPHGIAAHPGGQRVYVASLGSDQIASVAVADGKVRLVNVPGVTRGFVQTTVSPDGKWLAVTAELSDGLTIFDLTNPAAPRLVRNVELPDGPFEAIFTGDGRWVFVTCLASNRIIVLDAKDWQVVTVMDDDVFAQPHGVALSPDGRYVFVSNRHQRGGAHEHQGGQPTGKGTVVAICAASQTIDKVIPVGNYAAGMGTSMPRSVPPPSACR